jgi:ubiquinone/menaquinone biosynthesis C-methylase UbiE
MLSGFSHARRIMHQFIDRFPLGLKRTCSEVYISIKLRQNIKMAQHIYGIKYTPLLENFPLRIQLPLNLWLRATFPDGDIMRIHLTEERGYEDIDGAAHIDLYRRFAMKCFQLLDSELKKSRKSILDCACGSGYGANYLQNLLQKSVIGIDIDEDVIKYARKRYSSSSDRLSFIKANAMDLNMIKTASICSIVSVETIEHIPDPDKALSEFFRVLDPKGVLFITTPDATKHPNRWVSQFHIREYTPIQFQKLLEQHFRSINISTDGDRIIGICRKLPAAR